MYAHWVPESGVPTMFYYTSNLWMFSKEDRHIYIYRHSTIVCSSIIPARMNSILGLINIMFSSIISLYRK